MQLGLQLEERMCFPGNNEQDSPVFVFLESQIHDQYQGDSQYEGTLSNIPVCENLRCISYLHVVSGVCQRCCLSILP